MDCYRMIVDPSVFGDVLDIAERDGRLSKIVGYIEVFAIHAHPFQIRSGPQNA